jgi:hypothetical protein
MVGAAIVRLPAQGWQPAGYVPLAQRTKLITTNDVFVYQTLKTPQFRLIWWVLLVGGRYLRAGAGELHQAIKRRPWRGQDAGLQHHDVFDGRTVDGWFPVQPVHRRGA